MPFKRTTTARLAALNAFELAAILDSTAPANDQAVSALTDLRDEVIEANANDRWDARKKRGAVVHELADGAVPHTGHERLNLYTGCAPAWTVDLTAFKGYATAYLNWNNELVNRHVEFSATVAIGQALYLVYTDAARRMVEWLDGHDDDDQVPDSLTAHYLDTSAIIVLGQYGDESGYVDNVDHYSNDAGDWHEDVEKRLTDCGYQLIGHDMGDGHGRWTQGEAGWVAMVALTEEDDQ